MTKGYKKNQKNTDKFQLQGKGATWVRIRKEEAYTKLVESSLKENTIDPRVAEFLSDDSLEVVTHFGYEAPELLNSYCCALEDCMIEANKEILRLREELNKRTVG